MDEAERTEYLQRLAGELGSADAELLELEAALRQDAARGSATDDVPELAWARARCEVLRGWVEALYRRAAQPTGAPDGPLYAHAEHSRAALLRARLEVHERLQLLRQESAFHYEAQLRGLEEAYARMERAEARAPRPSRTLQLSLAWLRCELHATWRLLERMLRAEDRDWVRCRRDFERSLMALSHTAERLAPAPERMRSA
jgi:hypothetical protein